MAFLVETIAAEEAMTDTIAPLIVDLLVWLDREPRAYQEVMEIWRTSCPRLTVWEDAMDQGLISRERRNGCTYVVPTERGRALIARQSNVAVNAMRSVA
jgi:hypothetical protein